MADLLPVIEVMENRWMRAWLERDARTLKALTARDFLLLFGAKPAVLLDHRSWLEAAAGRYRCTSFRFGSIHVRELGQTAIFAAQLDLGASMDGHDWSGSFWVTDLWRKTRVRRRWKLAERIVSRTDDRPLLPAAIRSLQLWKSASGKPHVPLAAPRQAEDATP